MGGRRARSPGPTLQLPRRQGPVPIRPLAGPPKRVFKEAEARDDTEVLGALAARVDAEYGPAPVRGSARRPLPYTPPPRWRFLSAGPAWPRPACYADVAADFLARYDDSTPWSQTLVANHVFSYETGKYDRSGFPPRPTMSSTC